jgi:hypothetical protein
VFDLQPFLCSSDSALCQDTFDTCKRLASCLASTGCLVVSRLSAPLCYYKSVLCKIDWLYLWPSSVSHGQAK